MTEYIIDYRSIVRLILKLTGIVLMVYGVVLLASWLPTALLFISDSEPPFQDIVMLSSPLIVVIVGLILWLYPAPVTNTLLQKGTAEDDANQTWPAKLERIGISLLGLWLLYRAISDLIYRLMVYRARQDSPLYPSGYSEFPAYMTATLAELVFALFLIFGARGISRLLHKLRYGGLGIEKEPPDLRG